MKKVITALLNKTVNDKLKEFNEIEITMNDIQYQEGIIEALEINPEINFIILSELLPGELEMKELIEKIKNIKNEIKIIVILEKENKELENYLFAKGNINIFYNNEIKIKEIADLIINKNKEENLELEIQKLKNIIMNKNNNEIIYENKNLKEDKEEIKILITEEEKKEIEKEIENEYIEKNKIIKNISNLFNKKINTNDSKLIIISGISGVGKSIFTVNLAKQFEQEKKNILIIDFDFLNNSIKTLFGINNKKNKINYKTKYEINNKKTNKEIIENFYSGIDQEYNLEDLIVKINSKINLISNINLLFSENKIDDLKLLKIIKELKIKYDFILIDSNFNNEYLNYIIKECEKIIFITEPNILQIKKTKNILEKNINELKIEKEKIFILFNKVKNDSINFNILKEIFKNYNIIGKINFIKNCNLLINQNMKNIFLENKIKKQYKNIAKKISQNNNFKKYYLNKIFNE